MKILLTSIGTRGDMEPFLAIGENLKEKGHTVICAFPEQFKELADDTGLEFASLGPEFMEMIESPLAKAAMGGGGSRLKKIMAFVKLAKMQQKISKKIVKLQFEIVENEQPDRIVHSGKAIYPVIWAVENLEKCTYVSPVPYLHYVKGHTHVVFNSNYGEFLNKMTFKLAEWGLVKTIMASVKWLKIKDISKNQLKQVLHSHKVVYTVSPTLFSRPSHWRENMQVMGYHERNKTLNWQPDKELLSFLGRHPKLLFISFGSMTNPEPEKKTEVLLDILERNQIPAIINTSSGGLVEPSAYNKELLHFVEQIPYDWIFKKMYAVIHHGGSGTTHMGLKHGCATMIIPHIVDQFVWNKKMAEQGVGPKGIKIGKIRKKNIEDRIIDLMNKSSYKKNAEAIAAKMKKEDFKEDLYNLLTM